MLENGMQVVVLPDHRAPVVTHMIWYRVGSADEVKGKSGLAHFLEHLMFKGTPEIPAGEYSEDRRAQWRAGQRQRRRFDYTNYHFRVAKDRLAQMMRMEADRMVNLQLTDEEVAARAQGCAGRAAAEHGFERPAPFSTRWSMRRCTKAIPTPFRQSARWTEVAKLSREDALDWYHTWYGPENAILVVAGDITAAELKPLAQQIYGRCRRAET